MTTVAEQPGFNRPPVAGREPRRWKRTVVAGFVAGTTGIAAVLGGSYLLRQRNADNAPTPNRPGIGLLVPGKEAPKGTSLTVADVCDQITKSPVFQEATATVLGVPSSNITRESCRSHRNELGDLFGEWHTPEGAKLTISVGPRFVSGVDRGALLDSTFNKPVASDTYYNSAASGTTVVGPNNLISVSLLQIGPSQTTDGRLLVTPHPHAESTIGLAQTLAGLS